VESLLPHSLPHAESREETEKKMHDVETLPLKSKIEFDKEL
jgi:hypothetical protein